MSHWFFFSVPALTNFENQSYWQIFTTDYSRSVDIQLKFIDLIHDEAFYYYFIAIPMLSNSETIFICLLR